VRPTASASTIGAVEGRDVSSADGADSVAGAAGGGCGAATGMTIVGSWLLGSIRAVSSRPKSRYDRLPGLDARASEAIFDGAGSRSANVLF